MSRYAIPEMRKNGRGAIVNISSVSGRKSYPTPYEPDFDPI
jgi:NADP-dependent 3-hydroxy acid dehydrogenase YdfG